MNIQDREDRFCGVNGSPTVLYPVLSHFPFSLLVISSYRYKLSLFLSFFFCAGRIRETERERMIRHEDDRRARSRRQRNEGKVSVYSRG